MHLPIPERYIAMVAVALDRTAQSKINLLETEYGRANRAAIEDELLFLLESMNKLGYRSQHLFPKKDKSP